MSQCETKHGAYRCERQKGHKDEHGHPSECSMQMPEFRAVSTSEFIAMKRSLVAHREEIMRLKHVAEAARNILKVPPGCERYDEWVGTLKHALEYCK